MLPPDTPNPYSYAALWERIAKGEQPAADPATLRQTYQALLDEHRRPDADAGQNDNGHTE